MTSARRDRGATLVAALLLVTNAADAQKPLSPPGTEAAPAFVRLPTATVRDVEARERLFQRGLPVSAESFSPDGYHYAYLHYVRGGFLRRKPQRCAFLLDLGTGENRSLPTPQGSAARIGGWDPTGRYLLVESSKPDILSSLTGAWTTYHWVYDAVTSKFMARQPFTGVRDGARFRWKVKDVYHGEWDGERDAHVRPLYDGELAQTYQAREEENAREDARRLALAGQLAVGTGGRPDRVLAEVLPRLDARWTQRGQRDPVISDLFGDRPALYCRVGDQWREVRREIEHVAVLDHGLALVTGHGGAQFVLNVERREVLPLPRPPDDYATVLDNRWDRGGGFYDENDPLPRDLQYRRSWDPTQGTAYYFHFVTPDDTHALLVYPFGPERRILRIVDLPESWRAPARSAAGADADSLSRPAGETGQAPSAG